MSPKKVLLVLGELRVQLLYPNGGTVKDLNNHKEENSFEKIMEYVH